MTARKTIEVADILERTNHILSLPHISQEEKKALSMMVETVLHATGNYQGFRFWNPDLLSTSAAQEWDRFYYISQAIWENYEGYVELRKRQDGLR